MRQLFRLEFKECGECPRVRGQIVALFDFSNNAAFLEEISVLRRGKVKRKLLYTAPTSLAMLHQ